MQFPRRRGVEGGQLGHAFVHQLRHNLLRRASAKQRLPADNLEEHAPEREDIRAPIDGLTPHLLGRHVAQRAEDDVRGRAGQRRAVAVERRELEPAQRQAEVES